MLKVFPVPLIGPSLPPALGLVDIWELVDVGTARGAAAGCACLLAGMRRSFLIPHIGTTSLLKQRGREKEDNVYDDRVQDSKLIFLPCSPFFEMFNHPRPQDNSTRSKSLQHDQYSNTEHTQKNNCSGFNKIYLVGQIGLFFALKISDSKLMLCKFIHHHQTLMESAGLISFSMVWPAKRVVTYQSNPRTDKSIKYPQSAHPGKPTEMPEILDIANKTAKIPK